MCGSSQHAPSTARSATIVQQDPDNCFRILLATDNHIGYAEKDPVRGQDSINTFREILEIARDAEVDFILLAGDLFHENRPSRGCLYSVMALLREFSMGNKPVSFELMSDPMDGHAPGYSFPAINYEDSNLNVGIPVFSIHGNHDDPQGTGPEGALCALDMLSVSGLLNYFGKISLSADDNPDPASDQGIRIKPLLLRKGDTHLAMYGVGNVRDARMHYELRSNRVKMFMPEGGPVKEEDWFNMLLVHQNRVKHGPQQSVPEGMFDDSIKLVVWGHEHDCRIMPEVVQDKDYYITQPGSSVATSLAYGESIKKHVGILSIQGSQFQISAIPLKTVRPFIFGEVVLAVEAAKEDNPMSLEDKDSITAFLRAKVDAMVNDAKKQWKESHDGSVKDMMLPLIRLKVETTDAKEMTNPVRFGQDYSGRVANPRDILQYHRKKKVAERKAKNVPDGLDGDLEDEDDFGDDDAADTSGMTTSEKLSKLRMANLVRQYLQAQNLEVLVEKGLEESVMRFVDKDDKDAIKDYVQNMLKNVGTTMKGQNVDEDDVEEHMTRAKEHAASQWAENQPTEKEEKKRGKAKKAVDSDEDSMAAEDDPMGGDNSDASFASEPAPKKGKGKAPAKAKAPVKGKGKQPLFDDEAEDDDDDDEEEEEEEVVPQKKARPAPAKKAPALSPAKAPAKKAPAKKAAPPPPRQSQLPFTKGNESSKVIELSDSE